MLISFVLAGVQNTTEQAKTFIDIGDYSRAISILNEEILKNPRNVKVRKLLVHCFDEKEDWQNAIEELEVIQNLSFSPINDFYLLRLYALSDRFDKVLSLSQKYQPIEVYIGNLLSKDIDEFKKRISFLSDSLSIPVDSLQKLSEFFDAEKKLKDKVQFLEDSLGIKNYYLALGLYKLKNKEKFEFENLFEKAIALDSSFVDYIRKKVLDYIEVMEEPEPRLFATDYFYSDMHNYRQERGNLFKLIGLYDDALSEFRQAIYWIENDPNIDIEDLVSVWIKYNDYVQLLLKLKKYKQVATYVQALKTKYGESPIAEAWLRDAESGIIANTNSKTLLNDALEYFEQNQFRESKKYISLLKTYFRESTDAYKADSLLNIIEDQEERIKKEKQDEDKRLEEQRKENLSKLYVKIKEYQNSITTKKDDIEGITWYSPKDTYSYRNKYFIYAYIGQKGNEKPWLRFKCGVIRDKKIFFDEIIFSIDAERFNLPFEYSNKARDSYSEWVDVYVDETILEKIILMANSKTLKVRFANDSYVDFLISESAKEKIKTTIDYYSIIKQIAELNE